MTTVNVAIFISGYGSNALNLIRFFEKKEGINIRLLLSNNKASFALKKAAEMGVETVVFNNETFINKGVLLHFLQANHIDFVVLAGFLRLIPKDVTKHYRNKMVNIHPSLLPKYGGKGMYGRHIHLAVLKNGDTESGITIHYVNEEYDDGQLIVQKKVAVNKLDSLEGLTKKIQALEHKHYPIVVEQVVRSTFFNKNI